MLIPTRASAPPDIAPGSCWAKDTPPAVVETVTEQVVLAPAVIAPDGRVLTPAVTTTQTRRSIARARSDVWFEIPCEEQSDPQFIATLQRALAARNLYGGPISGIYDAPTEAAVRAYQRPRGLDSGVLSLLAARALGLVAAARS
jgi:hypothetical protein